MTKIHEAVGVKAGLLVNFNVTSLRQGLRSLSLLPLLLPDLPIFLSVLS
jgi:hypothetical protein